MKLFICVDDRKGMMFNNRRQSRDAILVSHMLDIVGAEKLFVLPYSEKLFKNVENITVSENPFEDCGETDFCFFEGEIKDISSVTELYIYFWNREYPFDIKFAFEPESEGFVLAESTDFAGSSHENITLKTFRREK